MKTALITDDALLMRSTLKQTLQEFDFDVIGEAINGVDAIEQFKKLKPHLVLMDITMPKMDGLEALKEIKKIDPEVIVVMCSAMNQKEIIVKSIQQGAFDFIVKPFNYHRVQETMGRVVAEIESRRKIG